MYNPIASTIPKGCPTWLILEDGAVEYHRRILLDDLQEPSPFRDSFITQFNLSSDTNQTIRQKIETLSITQIKAFSGY
tara:strand:+ start:147 stop:380 length:234 start_codon:yes stop_codon:yes gene_type:complete